MCKAVTLIFAFWNDFVFVFVNELTVTDLVYLLTDII